MKKLGILMFMLLAFTACSGVGNKNNIVSLLSAPKLSQSESEIIKAIESYSGESVTIKYSKSMGYSSPIEMVDIDEDGIKEALVFYYASNKGANIRLAVLKNISEKWTIFFDKEGLGSEVFFFEFTQLSDSGVKEVLVGYSTPNIDDKFLAAYFLTSDQTIEDYSEQCKEIIIGDMTNDGYDDVILTMMTSDKRTKIQIMSLNAENIFETVATYYLKVSDVIMTQMHIVSEKNKKAIMYIDYKDKLKKMYTEAVTMTDGKFENVLPAKYISRLWEYGFDLNSTDIDGDGRIEIPTVIHEDTQDTLPTAKYIEWVDFTQSTPTRKYYGICDTKTGLFMALADEWQDYVTVISNDIFWTVNSLENNAMLVKVKPIQLSEVIENTQENTVVRIGTKRWVVEFGSEVTQEQRQYILSGMRLLD